MSLRDASEQSYGLVSGAPGVLMDQVIADTGADASALPWADCQQLQLDPARGRPGLMSGVAGGIAPTLFFRIWVHVDGNEYPCRVQADFTGSERILGRDVLNRLEILFRGPAGWGEFGPFLEYDTAESSRCQ